MNKLWKSNLENTNITHKKKKGFYLISEHFFMGFIVKDKSYNLQIQIKDT